jgi:hypothetical protein
VFARALRVIAGVGDLRRQETLARAAVDLAAVRLDAATIDSIWEESAMPIPSLLNRRYQEGLEAGLERAAASLLRVRFGDDDRIEALAGRLARLGAAACIERIEAAGGLDELV